MHNQDYLSGRVLVAEAFVSYRALRAHPRPLEPLLIDRLVKSLARGGATEDVHIAAVQPEWHRNLFGDRYPFNERKDEPSDGEHWYGWGWKP